MKRLRQTSCIRFLNTLMCVMHSNMSTSSKYVNNLEKVVSAYCWQARNQGMHAIAMRITDSRAKPFLFQPSILILHTQCTHIKTVSNYI